MGGDRMKYAGIVNELRAFPGRVRAFLRERRGNVALIFSLSIIPIVIAGGAGIDLSRTLAARNALQYALDAAALAVATSNPPPSDLSSDQQQTIAQNYFNANYHLGASFGAPTPVQVTVTESTAVVTTTLDVPTTLMRVAFIDSVPLNSSSTATWGQTKLWVSLVLDNTGSMCEPGSQPCATPDEDSKMAALQTATHDLLTVLESASAHDGDVQVALIPFVKDVNVGSSNYNQSWIDWTLWDTKNGSCTISNKRSQSSCESAGSCSISGNNSKNSCESDTTGVCSNGAQTSEWSCENNKACSKSQYTSKNSCENHSGVWWYGTWTVTGHGVWTAGVWTPADHSTWNGCVMDRGDSSGPSTPAYDTTNTTPGSSSASKFPADQFSSCPEAITPLGYDWDDLSDKVDAMTAAGNTNQTIGLAWGWHALTDGAPLNPGTLPGNTTPVIILMTDGLNTENRWSSSQSSIDTRMGEACTNFKNWQYDASDSSKKPILYVVQVDIDGDDGISTVLQNCATSTSKYYHLTTAGATVTVFNQIATEITNMRVSQ
jgi:Flp pilus assembly protein TadG